MNPQFLRTTRSIASLAAGCSDWYRIENAMESVAEVYIYDEIGYLGVTAANFVRDLGKVTAGSITLHLNTPGGDVFEGLAIYNAIKDHRAEVTVLVDGIAASAGSFIAQAGDKVVMNRNSQMMIHDAAGLVIGNAKDMAEFAALLDKQSDNIASIYADRAGGSAASWRKAMKAETWYSAEEAVKAGLADEVAGKEGAAKNSWDLSIFQHQGREDAPEPEPIDSETFDPEAFRQALQEAFQ